MLYGLSAVSGAAAPAGTMASLMMELERMRNTLRKEGIDRGGDGVVLDVSESKNFQLLKTVLSEGNGEYPPHDGSRVMKMHYTGRLTSGEIFDSSFQSTGKLSADKGLEDAHRVRLFAPDAHERNGQDPFSFVLGAGAVIRGWDVGVATMTRGEHAILLCSPEYGYGQRTAGAIPPGSWLLFEVELLDWHERNHLTDNLPAAICYSAVVFGILLFLRWSNAI